MGGERNRGEKAHTHTNELKLMETSIVDGQRMHSNESGRKTKNEGGDDVLKSE